MASRDEFTGVGGEFHGFDDVFVGEGVKLGAGDGIPDFGAVGGGGREEGREGGREGGRGEHVRKSSFQRRDGRNRTRKYSKRLSYILHRSFA